MKKFLPFIKEDAELSKIKDKLWSTSKDIPEVILVGVLKTIYTLGLDEVRKRIDHYSDSTQLNKYKNLLTEAGASPVPHRVFTYLNLLRNYVDFDPIIHYINQDSVYYSVIQKVYYIENENEECLDMFSESGTPKAFSSKEDIEMYVFYRNYINEDAYAEKVFAYLEV